MRLSYHGQQVTLESPAQAWWQQAEKATGKPERVQRIWARPVEVWELMTKKEEGRGARGPHLCNSGLQGRYEAGQPRSEGVRQRPGLLRGSRTETRAGGSQEASLGLHLQMTLP